MTLTADSDARHDFRRSPSLRPITTAPTFASTLVMIGQFQLQSRALADVTARKLPQLRSVINQPPSIAKSSLERSFDRFLRHLAQQEPVTHGKEPPDFCSDRPSALRLERKFTYALSQIVAARPIDAPFELVQIAE